jgi:transposase
MRSVDCRRCGVTVEMVPWCDGRDPMTTTDRWVLATWARRPSWSEVARVFRTSWDSLRRAVEHAVEWGLERRDLGGLTALGIDEVAWGRGRTYLTLVDDIEAGTRRLVAASRERTDASLRSCLDGPGRAVCGQVCYIRSDLWQP